MRATQNRLYRRDLGSPFSPLAAVQESRRLVNFDNRESGIDALVR